MSLLFFAGFDNFGGGLVGGAGFGNDFPAKGAGLIGTPYETLIPITYGGATQPYNSMGVPNDDRWRIGAGAERRNTLVSACGGASNTYYATAKIGAGYPFTIGPGNYFSMTIGFNLTDFSGVMPTAGYYCCRFSRTAGQLANLIEHVAGTNNYRLAGSTGLYTFTPGQPVYLEFIVDVPAPSSSTNTFRARAYVNGELFFTNPAFSGLTPSTTEFFFEIGMDRVLSTSRYLGYSDIYVLDGTGEAPFNDRLGPQVILPFKPETVEATDWTMTGGTDPKTILTDGLDSTYLTSPVSKATISAVADLKLAPGSTVNGVAFFTRAGRDAGAPRVIAGTASRVLDGTPIGPPISSGTNQAPGYVTTSRFHPKTAAEREVLNFSDSGKMRFNISSEQPG